MIVNAPCRDGKTASDHNSKDLFMLLCMPSMQVDCLSGKTASNPLHNSKDSFYVAVHAILVGRLAI